MRALFIITFLIVGIYFLTLCMTGWMFKLNRSKKKGYVPKQGKMTMFHVRDLIIRGEKDLAIHVYCEIFQTNRQAATKAVDDLEKNIQTK